jgi:hypothetical protein
VAGTSTAIAFNLFGSTACKFRHANCDARARILDASFPILCAIHIRSLEVLFD